MKNPGTIAKLADGRRCIIYTEQPLLKARGKVILNLVDENNNLLMDNNRPKTIIKDVAIYNEEMQAAELIGYVD